MDLLGSILGSMEKPPTVGDAERKKTAEHKKRLEKIQEKEKEKINAFKVKIQKKVNDFIRDSSLQNFKFEPMEKVQRALVHEVADVAGLTSFSFGQDEVDRYVMLWKKEFAPSDEELAAYRRGEEWTPELEQKIAKEKELQKLEEEEAARPKKAPAIIPATNYKDKYEHLIGKNAAKDAAIITHANKSYGFVSSENKRDKRTIEQVMADSRAKRKKTDTNLGTDDNEDSNPTKEDS